MILALSSLLLVSVLDNPSGELKLGSKATLQCQVRGLTQGYTVNWKRPDGTMNAQSRTVELNSLASEDEGTWACVITHNEGTFNEILNLKVKGRTLTSKQNLAFAFFFTTTQNIFVINRKSQMYCVFAFRAS